MASKTKTPSKRIMLAAFDDTSGDRLGRKKISEHDRGMNRRYEFFPSTLHAAAAPVVPDSSYREPLALHVPRILRNRPLSLLRRSHFINGHNSVSPTLADQLGKSFKETFL